MLIPGVVAISRQSGDSIMKPQIIALLGSPVDDGNTARLLSEAIKGAEDAGCSVTKVDVTKLKFSPCMEYFYCEKNDDCMMKDDVSPFLKRFRTVDGLIIASPVMTMGFPGAIKSFMDRFQVFFMAKYVRKDPLVKKEMKKWRKALLISIGGMNVPYDFDGVRLSMRAFCDITDFEYWEDVLQNDMDSIMDITKRPDKIKEAYTKANDMCRLIAEDKAKYSPKDGVD